jgi:mRNA interferase MazF
MTPQRGEIWWVNLESMQESELRKMQPCLVLTANTLNRLRQTVVVVPLSAAALAHPPITVPMTCQGQPAVAIIDQIRSVAKYRLHSKIETASPARVQAILTALAQILEMT